ncbi:DinB family protein [Nocardioides donggukensis]|uniref:DinB family protein n=1 Tax=Nocardioides donggukensis TaxID=2774019 RepID=A0A927K8Z4_9ACTN|nr:DinB family protein [Nocardioides donggukensis]MBD8869830.1 DinB family protein [Nocardioides donggukensis]
MPIEPDLKDWTWVIDARCPECGFDGAGVDDLPGALRANAAAWPDVLSGPDAAVRPAEHVWSALEYACHVRDVHRVFDERVHRMLGEDDPVFANWDQDAAAVEADYWDQDPTTVADELVSAAETVAATYAGVGDRWERPGRRSNGSAFTVATIGRYHLHDVVHHLHDVGPRT